MPRGAAPGWAPAAGADVAAEGPFLKMLSSFVPFAFVAGSIKSHTSLWKRTTDRKPGEGVKKRNLIIYKKQLNPGGHRYSDNLFWARIVFPASSFTYVSLCFKSALTQPH